MFASSALAGGSETVVLEVKNMTCPTCAFTIRAALNADPGVTTSKVDSEAATVTVVYDPDRTTVPRIAKAITDAGFPARAKQNGR
jgi:copper chaperone CopZ